MPRIFPLVPKTGWVALGVSEFDVPRGRQLSGGNLGLVVFV